MYIALISWGGKGNSSWVVEIPVPPPLYATLDWALSEYSWICGAHFILGYKSNNPTSPDCIPSVFNHVKSPQKCKLLKDMERYERTASTTREE